MKGKLNDEYTNSMENNYRKTNIITEQNTDINKTITDKIFFITTPSSESINITISERSKAETIATAETEDNKHINDSNALYLLESMTSTGASVSTTTTTSTPVTTSMEDSLLLKILKDQGPQALGVGVASLAYTALAAMPYWLPFVAGRKKRSISSKTKRTK